MNRLLPPGIHRFGTDRLRNHFFVIGTKEEADRKLNEAGKSDFLMEHLDTLILQWIRADDDVQN